MKLSSKIWSAVGVLLIVLALAIWFVVVPNATKFPSKTNTTQHYSGTANLLDAQALGRGDTAHAFIDNAPVAMDRTVKVVKASGNTVVVTDIRRSRWQVRN
jgi:cytoskeletal protein RodZ